MPSKAEIRACPDLIADLAVEPTVSMSDFLARLPADSDDVDIDIITVLLEQQDYINQCRQKVIDDIVARKFPSFTLVASQKTRQSVRT